MTDTKFSYPIKCGIVSLGLYKHSGGPTKTINEFSKALKAPIFQFGDNFEPSVENYGLGQVKKVYKSNFFLKKFCMPNYKSSKYISKKLSKVNLISCHSYFRYHNLWTLNFSKKFNIPYWFVPHGSLDPFVLTNKNIRKFFFNKFIGKNFLDRASCIIFSSEREWEKAESVYGKLKGEILHWPTELCNQDNESSSNRIRVRNNLGIAKNAKVFLIFGRLNSMKNPLDTLRMIINASNKNFHVIILGPEDGVTYKSLKALSKKLNFENLHCIGPVYSREKFSYIHASDYYISLSERENFNHCAVEAMSCGLPVILSYGNDLGPIIENKNCGWWIQNIESLKILLKTIDNMELNLKNLMSNNAKKLCLDLFSFNNFEKKVNKLFLKYSLQKK